MKIKNIILASSIFAFAISLTSLSIFNMTKGNKIEEASASRHTAFTGLYKKVTSASELTAGTKVLLCSQDGDVIRDCGGNPGYLYTTQENVYRNANSELLYANNAYVVELTVANGSVSNSIALGGYYRMGWGSNTEHYGYIGWDIRGSNPSHPGSIDYDNVGIGYWKDATGIRKSVMDDTSFTVSFSDGYINLDNVGGHGRLGYTVGYDNRIVLGGGYRINLYKYVTPVNMNITVLPSTCESEGYQYNRGEKIDFAGMEVDIKLSDSDIVVHSFSYDNGSDRKFFTHGEYATGNGSVDVAVSFVNTLSKNVKIYVKQTEQSYIHVRDDLGDFRGECILAAYYYNASIETGEYHALGFKNADGTVDTRSADVSANGVITITAGSRINSTFFELVRIGGKYHLAKELDSGTKYLSSAGNSLDNSATDANALDVEYDSENHCAFLKKYGTSSYLRFAGNEFQFSTDTSDRAQLYKKELSDTQYESIETYVTNFQNATKVCVEDGKELTITSEIWSAQASAFAGLTSGAQGVIAGTTYTHNAEEYGSIKDIVDRYDYIISKYSQFDDFMARKGNSSYQNNYSQPINNLVINGQQNYAAIIALSIFVVLTASFSFALVIKKKKAKSK